MGRYVLRRLGLTAITLVLVSFAVFAASQLLPGDVGRTILGPYASQQQVDALDKSLGNDKPLPVRYWNWASDFVKGDWGVSPVQNVEVRPLVLGRLKNSLYLAAFAMVLIVPFSIFMGVVAALNYGKLVDRGITIVGLSFIALPEFVIGVILIVVFAVQLGWFPTSSQVPGTNPALQAIYTRTAILKGLPRRHVVSRHVVRNSMLPTITVVSVQVGYLVG